MARTPSDVRWPPGNSIDFDAIFERLLTLKRSHFPEHTARDLADPYIQILALVAALGQHGHGRLNHALLNLAPKYANSRRALISLMEIVNRPLRPMQPSRGPAYARVTGTVAAGETIIEAGQRIAQPGMADPIFTVDNSVIIGSIDKFQAWHYDYSGGSASIIASFPGSINFDAGDSIIIGFPDLFFNAVNVGFNGSPLPDSSAEFSIEYRSDDSGEPDSVTIISGQIQFELNGFLHTAVPGLTVTVEYKPTGVAEEVTTTVNGGSVVVTTSFLGQSSPSTSVSDYAITAKWRPVPDASDGTSSLSEDGTISFNPASVKSDTDDWVKDDDYGYAIRIRNISDSSGILPASIGITEPVLGSSGNYYADVYLTQGVRQTVSIGQTDGSSFQHMSIGSPPIDEPVADPAYVLEVGGDQNWFVVNDFSNSGSTSRHAIFREDPDDGWGIVFGNGTLGAMPEAGTNVKLTYRTGSTNPGDLDAGTAIRSIGGIGGATDYVLYRGTTGFAKPEASDRDSVLQFRYGILPQLSLRAESAITSSEIVTALTGGAPNRATFTTSDGRKPFSRALFSLTGVGARQYRVLVVGPKSSARGDVLLSDMREAEAWLNGSQIGVEVVNGHGPNNTEALVGSFVHRSLLPTITLTVRSSSGVRAQANKIVREFFKPHATDESGNYRWDFGGKVPIPILFGLLWEGVPHRKFVDISVTDGINTYDDGDYVQLEEFELPVLDESYDPQVNIIIVVEQ